jgi:hypothetical protein
MENKMKKYKLTKEHEAQFKPWADKWIANAMSTAPYTEEEKEKYRDAVEGLYRAANLTPPPRHRIVFVPSPFVLRFAGGYAAAIWWLRKNKKGTATEAATSDATWDATEAATRAATEAATVDATRDATWGATEVATRAATVDATRDATAAATEAATSDATWGATEVATRDATWDATEAATWGATEAATRDATWAATMVATAAATEVEARAATEAATRDATWAAAEDVTWAATRDATEAATEVAKIDKKQWFSINIKAYVSVSFFLNLNKFGTSCAAAAYNMWNGGNQWSGYSAYLSFFRHVAKLNLDYSKWDHYEVLATAGPRIMHPDFCMISERPTKLKVDDENRPHCENGPFCQWSTGESLYGWHGVRVPAYWIEQKHLLTAKDAITWENLEQRRAACEIVGWEKILKELNAITIDKDDDPQIGELLEVDLPDSGKERFIRVQCGTGRIFAIPVPPETKTALEGNAWSYGIEDWQGYNVEVRT